MLLEVPSATGNSTHGYFGGGAPGPKSTMDKITYASNTTVAVPSANLNPPRQNHAPRETPQQDTLVEEARVFK